MVEAICSEVCSHNVFIDNDRGEMVCENCGIVLDKVYRNSSYLYYESSDTSSISKQYLSQGDDLHFVGGNLGTRIISLRDASNKSLDPNALKKFKRLKKENDYFKKKSDCKRERIFTVLNQICDVLALPLNIRRSAAYLYRKIDPDIIINHVSCIGFCLWVAIRTEKNLTTLREVLSSFKERGSRVNKRSLIRDSCIYVQHLYEKGVKKSEPKTPFDYMPRLIGILSNNYQFLEKRLKNKNINIYKNARAYLIELEKLTYMCLDKLAFQLRLYAPHPFNYGAALIYFTDRLLALENNHKPVLTQEIFAKLTKVKAYTLRDLYVKRFKHYYLKEEERKSTIRIGKNSFQGSI